MDWDALVDIIRVPRLGDCASVVLIGVADFGGVDDRAVHDSPVRGRIPEEKWGPGFDGQSPCRYNDPFRNTGRCTLPCLAWQQGSSGAAGMTCRALSFATHLTTVTGHSENDFEVARRDFRRDDRERFDMERSMVTI